MLDKFEQQDLLLQTERLLMVDQWQEMLGVISEEVLPGVLLNFELFDHLTAVEGLLQNLGELLHFESKFVDVGVEPVVLVEAGKGLQVEFGEGFLQVEELGFKVDNLVGN